MKRTPLSLNILGLALILCLLPSCEKDKASIG
jgi:hypothetical protein